MSVLASSSPSNTLSSTTGGGSTGRRSAEAIKRSVRSVCGLVQQDGTFCARSTSSRTLRLLDDRQLVGQMATVFCHSGHRVLCLVGYGENGCHGRDRLGSQARDLIFQADAPSFTAFSRFTTSFKPRVVDFDERSTIARSTPTRSALQRLEMLTGKTTAVLGRLTADPR